ncbi:hypothetical protein HanPSC8_Chr03g0085191 [Helianthus annuus]|nr:hypothetical protein HanPSC8_Chr03g0085191 [Helianthus annuus]
MLRYKGQRSFPRPKIKGVLHEGDVLYVFPFPRVNIHTPLLLISFSIYLCIYRER